jgi:chromosome segregation ATPase
MNVVSLLEFQTICAAREESEKKFDELNKRHANSCTELQTANQELREANNKLAGVEFDLHQSQKELQVCLLKTIL